MAKTERIKKGDRLEMDGVINKFLLYVPPLFAVHLATVVLNIRLVGFHRY